MRLTQLPVQRCTRLPQSRTQLAPTEDVRRGSEGVGVGVGVSVRARGWKENNRPHSVSPAPLTSSARPAEALPPALGPGHSRRCEGWGCQSRIPRRCRPRSPSCCSSSGARQRRLRCRRLRCRRRCRPRWMSSHTWRQGGRRMWARYEVLWGGPSGYPHFPDKETGLPRPRCEREAELVLSP